VIRQVGRDPRRVKNFKDRSANGTSASGERAERITRSNSRGWSGWMRAEQSGDA